MTQLVSVESGASRLGISPWTVRAYIREGKLRPVRLGRRVLLEVCELERFVASSKDAMSAPISNEIPAGSEEASTIVEDAMNPILGFKLNSQPITGPEKRVSR